MVKEEVLEADLEGAKVVVVKVATKAAMKVEVVMEGATARVEVVRKMVMEAGEEKAKGKVKAKVVPGVKKARVKEVQVAKGTSIIRSHRETYEDPSARSRK